MDCAMGGGKEGKRGAKGGADTESEQESKGWRKWLQEGEIGREQGCDRWKEEDEAQGSINVENYK